MQQAGPSGRGSPFWPSKATTFKVATVRARRARFARAPRAHPASGNFVPKNGVEIRQNCILVFVIFSGNFEPKKMAQNRLSIGNPL